MKNKEYKDKKKCNRSTRVQTQAGCGLFSSKRSQITLFVIIGIVIIGIVALIFIFKDSILPSSRININPADYMDECIRGSVDSAQNKVISHGGFLDPKTSSVNYVIYNYTQTSLFCYTSNNQEPCVNNHPVLKKEIESEITSIIKPEIEKCFSEMESKLKSRIIEKTEIESFKTEIVPGEIRIEVKKRLVLNEGDQTQIIEKFDTEINSPLYSFISLSNEIINQELDCDCENGETCNANLVKLNENNKDFEISKPAYSGNGEEVFVIKDISTDKDFIFGIRNCVRGLL